MLTPVEEHRRAHAFPQCDTAFRSDQIDTVVVVVGLGLAKELDFGVQTSVKAEVGKTPLTQYKASITVLGVDLPGELDVVHGRLAPIELHKMGVAPLHVSSEKPHPIVKVGAHFHQSVPCLPPTFIRGTESHKLADISPGDAVQRESVVGAGALDVIDGELDTMLVARDDHGVCFDKTECRGFLAEDVDAPLCGRNGGIVVLRGLRRDDDDVWCQIVQHLLEIVI